MSSRDPERLLIDAELTECFGKRQFDSPAQAREARRLVRRRGRRNRLTAYRCRFCQSWHLGTPDRMRRSPRPETEPMEMEDTLIIEKRIIQDAYKAAAEHKPHEEALQLVAQQFMCDEETVAEVLTEAAEC